MTNISIMPEVCPMDVELFTHYFIHLHAKTQFKWMLVFDWERRIQLIKSLSHVIKYEEDKELRKWFKMNFKRLTNLCKNENKLNKVFDIEKYKHLVIDDTIDESMFSMEVMRDYYDQFATRDDFIKMFTARGKEDFEYFYKCAQEVYTYLHMEFPLFYSKLHTKMMQVFNDKKYRGMTLVK